jgi:hypothetical protein
MVGVVKVGLHACVGGCGQGWASCLCWWVWPRLGFVLVMVVMVGVAKVGLHACVGCMAKVGLHACNNGYGLRLGFMLVMVGVAKVGLRACNGGCG